MEHGQHRRGADAGAEQDDGPFIAAQCEGAARRRCLDGVAHPHVLVQEGAPDAVGFALDADAVRTVIGGARERVAADDRRAAAPLGRRRTVRYCPGLTAPDAGRAPSAGVSVNEVIVALSRRMAVTVSGGNPGQAGGAGVCVAVSSCSSRVRNEPFHPSLSAGILSARSSVRRERSGR